MQKALDQFIAAIQSGEDDKANGICQLLTSEAEPSLIALASEPAIGQQVYIEAAEARWWSIRALALCGGPNSMPMLSDALTDANAEIRATAALAIGEIYERLAAPNPEVLVKWMEKIAHLLTDDQGFVRQAAADALVLFGNHSIPVLAVVLGQTHPGARVRAAYALRKIGTMETVPLLFQYLNDTNYLVHTYVHEALDELGMFDNVLVTL